MTDFAFFTKGTKKDEVHNSNTSIAIIDTTDPLTNRPWSFEDVSYMKNHDKPKLIVGEIPHFDVMANAWYWKKEWKVRIVPWSEVAAIIVPKMIETGFDGVYVEENLYDTEIAKMALDRNALDFKIYRKQKTEEEKQKTRKAFVSKTKF